MSKAKRDNISHVPCTVSYIGMIKDVIFFMIVLQIFHLTWLEKDHLRTKFIKWEQVNSLLAIFARQNQRRRLYKSWFSLLHTFLMYTIILNIVTGWNIRFCLNWLLKWSLNKRKLSLHATFLMALVSGKSSIVCDVLAITKVHYRFSLWCLTQLVVLEESVTQLAGGCDAYHERATKLKKKMKIGQHIISFSL